MEDNEPLFDDVDEDFAEEAPLDPADAQFVHEVVTRCLAFGQEFCGFDLYGYQYEFGYRFVESVVLNDGEEITALFSRQSGKTQTVALCIVTMMILFPKLAKTYELFEKFKDGVMVGVFGPTDEQATIVFSRIVGYLTSERAVAYLGDPEIDDQAEGKSKLIRLRNSGSFCRRQTANPRAKIEGSSYHVICIDESQDADEQTVRKSIHPMGAFYNATIVKTGTPAYVKGDFYKAIQSNKRRHTRRGARRNHFEYDWRHCAKHNKNYAKYVEKERRRLGEDSDEFRMAYEIRWMLDRGMYVTSELFDQLGDRSMNVVRDYWQTPVLVGIDPARTQDSTVVTVVWVDWDRPDEFGLYEHRPIAWLELHGMSWEEQYFRIVDFLRHYNVAKIAVDCQGVGDAVADRLTVLLPDVEVVPIPSTIPEQSKRWKHLKQLMERGLFIYPAHSKTRRLRVWKRFYQQFTDLEVSYKGPNMMAEAPDESDAHDDYPDSAALACVLSIEDAVAEVEVVANPFFSRR